MIWRIFIDRPSEFWGCQIRLQQRIPVAAFNMRTRQGTLFVCHFEPCNDLQEANAALTR